MSDPLGAPSRSSLVMGTIVVVAAVIVTGALFAWLALDDGTESLSERGPATPKALAALTVEVLAIEPDSYDVVQEVDEGAAVVSMSAAESSFEVSVSEDDGEDPDCEVMDGCDHWDEAGGTVWLRWQEQEPEEDPGIVYVTWVGDGEVHEVSYYGVLIEPDPREQDLPVSVDRMVDLVTDPRMGLTMPVYLEDTELDGWPEDDDAQSPRELTSIDAHTFAALVRPSLGIFRSSESLPFDEYGEGTVGFRAVVDDGSQVTFALVRDDSPALPACSPRWQCTDVEETMAMERPEGLLAYGWDDGVLLGELTFDEGTVVATLESKQTKVDPRDRPEAATRTLFGFRSALENYGWGEIYTWSVDADLLADLDDEEAGWLGWKG